VRGFELPERLKHFLTPGIILLSLLFLTGGVYFWNQSLTFSPQTVADEGTVSGVETNVPDSFPEDIPLFEPAEILSSFESQKSIQVTMQTEASVERVTQFYEREMPNDSRVELAVTADPEGPTTIILTITL